MIDTNYPTEDVRKMKNSLSQEGWVDSMMLPRDWKYRRNKQNNNLEFISDKGHFFNFEEVSAILKKIIFIVKSIFTIYRGLNIKSMKGRIFTKTGMIQTIDFLKAGRVNMEIQRHIIIFHPTEWDSVPSNRLFST